MAVLRAVGHTVWSALERLSRTDGDVPDCTFDRQRRDPISDGCGLGFACPNGSFSRAFECDVVSVR